MTDNMISKAEIIKIKDEIKNYQLTINELEEKKSLKAKELLDKVLSCKEVLNETKWAFSGDNQLYSKDTQHKMLTEFLQTEYHCHFENDYACLYFDDWDIHLIFKKPHGLMDFVQKFGIVLDVESLQKRATEIKKGIELDLDNLKKLEEEIRSIGNFGKNNAL